MPILPHQQILGNIRRAIRRGELAAARACSTPGRRHRRGGRGEVHHQWSNALPAPLAETRDAQRLLPA